MLDPFYLKQREKPLRSGMDARLQEKEKHQAHPSFLELCRDRERKRRVERSISTERLRGCEDNGMVKIYRSAHWIARERLGLAAVQYRFSIHLIDIYLNRPLVILGLSMQRLTYPYQHGDLSLAYYISPLVGLLIS